MECLTLAKPQKQTTMYEYINTILHSHCWERDVFSDITKIDVQNETLSVIQEICHAGDYDDRNAN